ncbi:MAG: hypothetical protein Q7R62_01875 [bacterium]|nr:hypothetical protein [bacterium]
MNNTPDSVELVGYGNESVFDLFNWGLPLVRIMDMNGGGHVLQPRMTGDNNVCYRLTVVPEGWRVPIVEVTGVAVGGLIEAMADAARRAAVAQYGGINTIQFVQGERRAKDCGALCLLAGPTRIGCPEDSCDLETGTRKMPEPNLRPRLFSAKPLSNDTHCFRVRLEIIADGRPGPDVSF